jgi:hypothetical protein
MEGYTGAVCTQNVPRCQADIASFAEMQELSYACVERELANIRHMGVVSGICQAGVPTGATVLNSELNFPIKCNLDGNPAE